MKPAPRLFLESPLLRHGECELSTEQRHYLVNVLRLVSGDPVKVFNAVDGEWLAHLATVGKRTASLRCERKTADVQPPPDIDYLFAPLKHARLDYVIQKATELGAKRLRPVVTHRTITERINLAQDAHQCHRGGRTVQPRLRSRNLRARCLERNPRYLAARAAARLLRRNRAACRSDCRAEISLAASRAAGWPRGRVHR